MIESVILALIYACVFALLLYVVLYVLGILGVPLPAKVVQIIWLIFGLFILLWILRAFVGAGGLTMPLLNFI